jgi:hypothetical protein
MNHERKQVHSPFIPSSNIGYIIHIRAVVDHERSIIANDIGFNIAICHKDMLLYCDVNGIRNK